MQVSYKGRTKKYPYRIAELIYRHNEEEKALDLNSRLEEEYGFNVNGDCEDDEVIIYTVLVDDFDDFRELVHIIKSIKKRIGLR